MGRRGQRNVVFGDKDAKDWLPNQSYKRKNEMSKCGDETNMGNRRKKVPERFQKKDGAVQLSGCGSHVVGGRTFRLEGENTAEKLKKKMVFGFGKMHARLGNIRRNKKRQDQDQSRAESKAI